MKEKESENINALLRDQVFGIVYSMCAEWFKQEKSLLPKAVKTSILKELCELNLIDIERMETIMLGKDSEFSAIIMRLDILYACIFMRIGTEAILRMQNDFAYLIYQLDQNLPMKAFAKDKLLKERINKCPWVILIPFFNKLYVADSLVPIS